MSDTPNKNSSVDIDALMAEIRERAAVIEASGKLPPDMGQRAADHYRTIVKRHRQSEPDHPDPILDERLKKMERQAQHIGELVHQIAFLQHAVSTLGRELGYAISFNDADDEKGRISRRFVYFRHGRHLIRKIKGDQ